MERLEGEIVWLVFVDYDMTMRSRPKLQMVFSSESKANLFADSVDGQFEKSVERWVIR